MEKRNVAALCFIPKAKKNAKVYPWMKTQSFTHVSMLDKGEIAIACHMLQDTTKKAEYSGPMAIRRPAASRLMGTRWKPGSSTFGSTAFGFCR